MIVVPQSGEGGSLAFDVVDAETGTIRNRLHFPQRHGLIGHGDNVAAVAWDVSPDGRRLALAEGWKLDKPTTPIGVEIYDLQTGALFRRLSTYPPMERTKDPKLIDSVELGACRLQFRNSFELNVIAGRRQRDPVEGNIWYVQTSDPEVTWNVETGEKDAPHPPDSHVPVTSAVGSRRAVVETHGPTTRRRVRIVDSSAAILSDWFELPDVYSTPGVHIVIPDEMDGAVIRGADVERSANENRPAWLTRLPAFLQDWWKRPDGPTVATTWYWYDWNRGTLSELSTVVAAKTDFVQTDISVVGDKLAILIALENSATIEVWSAPPPQACGWWATAGIAATVGTLAGGLRKVLTSRKRERRS